MDSLLPCGCCAACSGSASIRLNLALAYLFACAGCTYTRLAGFLLFHPIKSVVGVCSLQCQSDDDFYHIPTWRDIITRILKGLRRMAGHVDMAGWWWRWLQSTRTHQLTQSRVSRPQKVLRQTHNSLNPIVDNNNNKLRPETGNIDMTCYNSYKMQYRTPSPVNTAAPALAASSSRGTQN